MPYKDAEERRGYAHRYHEVYKETHCEELRDYRRRYYEKNKERIKQYRLDHKAELKESSKKWYQAHWAEQKVAAKKRRLAIKHKVLTHYGNAKCACVKCGESRLACLSIDHINGRKDEHLRGLGWQGGKIYRWLIKQGYPEGYQTLCMNCQWIKRAENNETRKQLSECSG